jgi:hypothetical protein
MSCVRGLDPEFHKEHSAAEPQPSSKLYHRRDAEFTCFDRSRSLTAGFLDGLQFRSRRGITTSGILHSRAS